MATTSSYPTTLLPLILILLTLISCSFSSAARKTYFIRSHKTRTNTFGFTSSLIHSDSPDSLFYNPSLTHGDRVRAAVRRSLSRYHSFQNNIENPNQMRSPVSFDGFEYVMNHYIGTPPTETYTLVDTGSPLIWLQCLPCESCLPQKVPVFDPSKSSSYTKIGCEDEKCKFLPTVRCDKDDNDSCHYGISYAGTTSSEGTLSTETFVFDDDGKSGNISILELAFGCGHKNQDPFGGSKEDDIPPGVMGLNRHPSSLISQLSLDRFSHCLVVKNSSQSSLIHFGRDAVITDTTTPMLDSQGSINDNYYMSVEGISIGNDRLNIPSGSFNMTPKGEGGVFIDSGTSYTVFNEKVHDVLVTEMGKRIQLPKGVDPLQGFELCYKGKFDDFKTTPDVTFHFTGVDLVLSKLNTWIDAGEGNVCLAMLKGSEELNVVGNHQLQNVNVGFDLEKKLISIKTMDCNYT